MFVSQHSSKPPVVRSPFPLSISRVLYFNCVNLKTVTQAEQEGKLFGRLASGCGFCVPANVLALWRWLLETSHIVTLVMTLPCF